MLFKTNESHAILQILKIVSQRRSQTMTCEDCVFAEQSAEQEDMIRIYCQRHNVYLNDIPINEHIHEERIFQLELEGNLVFQSPDKRCAHYISRDF